MPRPPRSPLSTVLWLTLYVGVAPFMAVLALMLSAKWILALDESWGVVFGVLYLGLVFAGSRELAKHFERDRR